MGKLVVIANRRVFGMLWTCWTKGEQFGVQVKGREKNKLAEQVEDTLRENSQSIEPNLSFRCKCGEVTMVEPRNTEFDRFWKMEEDRNLNGPFADPIADPPTEDEPIPAIMYFENAEFTLLKEHVDAIIPLQKARAHYNMLQSIFEEAELKWTGKEMEVRAKYLKSIQPLIPQAADIVEYRKADESEL